jgi:peroxiredoxin
VKQHKSWWRRALLLGAELLVIVTLLLGGEWWMTRGVERGVVISLSGTTTDGNHFDLQQWRGKSGIIYFWADWCPICRANRPVITALSADYPVMTIAMQSGERSAIASYLQKEQITFPVIADPEGALARRFHVKGVPLVLIVDAKGRVRYVARGYTTELGLRARLWLAS